MSRRRTLAVLATAAFGVAGCAAPGGSEGPTWVPSPAFGTAGEGPGVQLSPIAPQPSQGAAGQGGGTGTSQPGRSTPSSAAAKVDPLVVATRLTAPVGLTMLPDNTALVGERTTGRIVRVQPTAGKPVPTVRRLTGLDTSGDGGLLDLALSPTYDQDELIYAYITTRTDNRVVDFTLTGPVTPVLTGIPRGRIGNAGRLAFGSDGVLYVGTGDVGRPALAANPRSLAGKVLRIDDIGRPAADNPTASSPIWSSGHSAAAGLCPVPDTPLAFEVEPGIGTAPDELNLLRAGGAFGVGSPAGITTIDPAATLPAAYPTPGGCAVRNSTVYVTSLDGKALLAARVRILGDAAPVGAFTAVLHNTYGRLRTVVAADDGALWLTTANRSGNGKPVRADERVIRYLPPANGGRTNPA